MSLTPDSNFCPPETPAPTVLDQRAPIANLSRRIVVQGADDADWRDHKFGAHLMVMDLASKVTIAGAEFRRVVRQASPVATHPLPPAQLQRDYRC
jgi:hypothetical protein